MTGLCLGGNELDTIKELYLPKIMKNCEMLKLLINDILDYS